MSDQPSTSNAVTWNWAAALVPFWLAYHRRFLLQLLSSVAFAALWVAAESALRSWPHPWSVWQDVGALALAYAALGAVQGLVGDRLVRSRASAPLEASGPPPPVRGARRIFHGPSVLYAVGFAAVVFGFVIRGVMVSEMNAGGWILLRAVPSEPARARALGRSRALTAVVAPECHWIGELPRVREAWAVPVTRTAWRMVGGSHQILMGDLIVLELENHGVPLGAQIMADSVDRRWSHGCFENPGPGPSTCGIYGPAPDTLFLRLCRPLYPSRDADSVVLKLEECPFGL